MLRLARQKIIAHLWENYRQNTPHMQTIEAGLHQLGIQKLVLDHFAIIDLPSPHSGISQLSQLFAAIGYRAEGRDYLADKQNDFLWMAEENSHTLPANEVLPQVVVADFRLSEIPPEIQLIIEKYINHTQPAPLPEVTYLAKQVTQGDQDAIQPLVDLIIKYLSGRDWPLPTVSEFKTLQAFNELMAWVFVFGRRPNHFTLSVHHLLQFNNMHEFNELIENQLHLKLNHEGGKIKGGIAAKIAQGSTAGILQTIPLSDGDIELPTGFVEFVWRYPQTNANTPPLYWNDFFTGFVAQYADHVIESLYRDEKKDTLSKIQG